MEDETKKQLKILSIAITVFIVIIFIAAVFMIRSLSTSKEYDGISAREAFDILMRNEEYQQYENNISSVHSRGLTSKGLADEWSFSFGRDINDTTMLLSINVYKNGTCILQEDLNVRTDLPFISNWDMDSTEIMEIVEDLDEVKDFKRKYRWQNPRASSMTISTFSDHSSFDCVILVRYQTKGDLFTLMEQIGIMISGETGDLIEVVEYI